MQVNQLILLPQYFSTENYKIGVKRKNNSFLSTFDHYISELKFLYVLE